jgi:hypothetical protein
MNVEEPGGLKKTWPVTCVMTAVFPRTGCGSPGGRVPGGVSFEGGPEDAGGTKTLVRNEIGDMTAAALAASDSLSSSPGSTTSQLSPAPLSCGMVQSQAFENGSPALISPQTSLDRPSR